MYSIQGFFVKKVYFRPGMMPPTDLDVGCLYIIFSVLCFITGLAFFYLAFRPKSHIKQTLEVVKCKKCQKTFAYYKDTNNGKCPKCNIDTIEISKYYEVKKQRKEEKWRKRWNNTNKVP